MKLNTFQRPRQPLQSLGLFGHILVRKSRFLQSERWLTVFLRWINLTCSLGEWVGVKKKKEKEHLSDGTSGCHLGLYGRCV